MKITAKTTKQELKDFLGANANTVKKQDKTLFERLAYADAMMKKDEKKVTRRDLADLAKEVIRVLGDKVVTPALAEEPADKGELHFITPVETLEPVAENSVKKAGNGVAKVQEKKADTTAKKSLGAKKPTPKKDGVTELEPTTSSKKAVQMAKMFPQTLTVGDTNYELADDIENMEDLYEAVQNDEEIVFAYYWTTRHLKQFDYFGGWLGQPKSFDNDLDLASAIYVSDEKKVSYQLSMYTDAIYTILPKDFEVIDGIRVSGGIEFQIYRAVTE